jgi:hypothetical protein
MEPSAERADAALFGEAVLAAALLFQNLAHDIRDLTWKIAAKGAELIFDAAETSFDLFKLIAGGGSVLAQHGDIISDLANMLKQPTRQPSLAAGITFKSGHALFQGFHIYRHSRFSSVYPRRKLARSASVTQGHHRARR